MGLWDAGLPSEQSRTSLTHCSAPWLNTARGGEEEGRGVRRRGSGGESGGGAVEGSQEEGQ